MIQEIIFRELRAPGHFLPSCSQLLFNLFNQLSLVSCFQPYSFFHNKLLLSFAFLNVCLDKLYHYQQILQIMARSVDCSCGLGAYRPMSPLMRSDCMSSKYSSLFGLWSSQT